MAQLQLPVSERNGSSSIDYWYLSSSCCSESQCAHAQLSLPDILHARKDTSPSHSSCNRKRCGPGNEASGRLQYPLSGIHTYLCWFVLNHLLGFHGVERCNELFGTVCTVVYACHRGKVKIHGIGQVEAWVAVRVCACSIIRSWTTCG